MASSFLNAAGTIGRVTISERIEAGRRERRVLARVSWAAWRLEQAERERTWALVSARAEGISIRTLATAAGLSPSRVYQLVAAADLDALDAALGELRAAGWPAPEDPDSEEDAELGGRDTIAGRLCDEVSWLQQCADWLAHLDADSYPPAVSLRPAADRPDRAVVRSQVAENVSSRKLIGAVRCLHCAYLVATRGRRRSCSAACSRWPRACLRFSSPPGLCSKQAVPLAWAGPGQHEGAEGRG